MAEQITRRRLLGLAGAGAAGTAVACACSAPALAAPRRAQALIPWADRQHFVTHPGMQPPPITVTQYGHVSRSRYIFLDSPYSGPGIGGALIINSLGELVWFSPDTSTEHKLDFNVQNLHGKPVLTWFQGKVVSGHGEGEAVIADNTYQVTHVINARNGLKADLHEFFITPRNTAIISIFRRHEGVDLSRVGGGKSGYILSGVFQEIDITTGELIFEWDSYPHVPLERSYLPLRNAGRRRRPYDYFHINSICTDDTDGNYLVSSRHTWTIYKINAANGSIMWRMNGKASNFTMGPGAAFRWQHHVRPHGHGAMTVFDNGAGPAVATEGQSRALILSVDEKSRHVELRKAYTHPGAVVLTHAEGSVQPLPSGDVFVDWGGAARFSQFAADGTLVLDGTMNPLAPSYRGFSEEWTGKPATLPIAAARRSAGGATVHASWNGATEVASWTVYAGAASAKLRKIKTAPKRAFETAIAVKTTGPYFAVQARDASGKALAKSKVVRIS